MTLLYTMCIRYELLTQRAQYGIAAPAVCAALPPPGLQSFFTTLHAYRVGGTHSTKNSRVGTPTRGSSSCGLTISKPKAKGRSRTPHSRRGVTHTSRCMNAPKMPPSLDSGTAVSPSVVPAMLRSQYTRALRGGTPPTDLSSHRRIPHGSARHVCRRPLPLRCARGAVVEVASAAFVVQLLGPAHRELRVGAPVAHGRDVGREGAHTMAVGGARGGCRGGLLLYLAKDLDRSRRRIAAHHIALLETDAAHVRILRHAW
eukprot:1943813-Prymnesium_polylepis.4